VVLHLDENGKWMTETVTLLQDDMHPQISVEELIAAEVVVKNNPTVQKLAKEVGE